VTTEGVPATRPEGGRGPARLLIVDDHDFVRSGIRVMLSGEPDLKIVGEAADGQEALELCRRERPDLVLMDVRMPRMDGLAATQSINRRFPRVSVLILTMHENEGYLLEAIKAGAAGYVLKDASQNELVTAIREVLEGETTLNRRLATGLLRRLASESGRPTGARPGNRREELAHPLTPRELEVLQLVALGRTNREVAEGFVISVGTVKNHVEHIIAKLGASDRTQAVVRALELGLIDFPQP
jgi:two-component system, NarL family, response regulator DegU